MQYENKRSASLCRALSNILFTIIGFLVVIAFLGDDETLHPLRWVFLGAGALLFCFLHMYGLHELAIQANKDFVEVRCMRIFAKKGSIRTYTIQPTSNLLSFSLYHLFLFNYLRMSYIGHTGKTRTAWVELTLMNSRARKSFIKVLTDIRDGKGEMVEQDYVSRHHHHHHHKATTE